MQVRKIWFTAAAAVVALSCDGPGVTGVDSDVEPPRGEAERLLFSPKALVCPASNAATTSATVGPLGGLVSVGGTSISIPAGALLEPVTLSVTVPASNYLEIDVSVAGHDHFAFQLPVVVTVDYGRCNRTDILSLPISAWYFEGDPKTLLERMPSVDNKLARTVTFITGHLSGYILAN
jgi:hypothetical protein